MAEQKKVEQKKQPYTPPKLTDHGRIVEETRGMHGKCWETYGSTTDWPD